MTSKTTILQKPALSLENKHVRSPFISRISYTSWRHAVRTVRKTNINAIRLRTSFLINYSYNTLLLFVRKTIAIKRRFDRQRTIGLSGVFFPFFSLPREYTNDDTRRRGWKKRVHADHDARRYFVRGFVPADEHCCCTRSEQIRFSVEETERIAHFFSSCSIRRNTTLAFAVGGIRSARVTVKRCSVACRGG